MAVAKSKIVRKDNHLIFEDGRFYVTETPYEGGRQSDFPKKIDVTDMVVKAVMPKQYIDIDKFVVRIMDFTPVPDYVKYLIREALKDQGIIYKDGSLIKIGSKKCEGKLKEMLDEEVLANSCKSSKDEQKILSALRIEKGKWYMCLHPSKGFVKGRCYKANKDGSIEGDNAYMYVGNDPTDFRLATELEIRGDVGECAV